MTGAKLATLVLLTAIWIIVGLGVAFFTLPLWGMSIDAPTPWWTYFAVAVWVASYSALATAIIHSKEIG